MSEVGGRALNRQAPLTGISELAVHGRVGRASVRAAYQHLATPVSPPRWLHHNCYQLEGQSPVTVDE
jgi:hypothetical protein